MVKTGKAVMKEEQIQRFGKWTRTAVLLLTAGFFVVGLIRHRQSMGTLVVTVLLTLLLAAANTLRMGDCAVAALLMGLVMGLFTGQGGYVGIFGATVLLGALFTPLGRFLEVAAFFFGALGVGITCEQQLLYELVPALLTSGVLFLMVPEDVLSRVRDSAGTGKYAGRLREEKRMERHAHQLQIQISEHARRWQDLAEIFGSLPMERELFLQGARTLRAYEGLRTGSRTRSRLEVMSGVARAVGGRDCVSGDNYSTMALEDGRFLVLISDGMGSGRQAYHDSDQVISRMEQLVETGFSLPMATTLVHRWLLSQNREDVGTTLDAVLLDLTSGVGTLMKAGAAASYLLYQPEPGVWQVELLNPESMPLGILEELHTGGCEVHLHPGDVLVMMTDGVLESLAGAYKEERMRGFLEYEAAKLMDPSPARFAQALAAAILDFARSDGERETEADDRTIVTFYIAPA